MVSGFSVAVKKLPAFNFTIFCYFVSIYLTFKLIWYITVNMGTQPRTKFAGIFHTHGILIIMISIHSLC